MSQPNERFELDVIVLAGKLGSLTQGVHHAITLSALLALYIGIAKNNRCCAQAAINALLDAAEEISGIETPDTDVQSLRTETIVVH